MNLTNILSKIKLMVSEEIKLTDVKTQDGIILSYDGELVVGVEIFVVDETGKNPAPDAEYILEDGTKIVAEAGLVKEVEAPEAPIEEAPIEETPVAEMPVEAEVATLSLEDLQSRIVKLEEENAEIKEILSVLAESFSKEAFNKEVKMSLVKPVENVKHVTDDQVNLSRKNNELNNIFKNMYKNK